MVERRKDPDGLKPEMGYERRDVKVKAIINIGVAIFFIIFVFLVLLNELFISVREDIVYDQFLSPKSQKLIDVQARDDSVLTTYGAINKDDGIYRIPVDRAIDLVVEDYKK